MNDKKLKIINAAKKSFSHFGYKATTMDQIAKIAQVGKGTIYTYFSSKEEMLKAIINLFVVEMRDVAESAILRRQPFIKSFNEVLHTITKFQSEHELMIKLSQEVKEIGTPEVIAAMKSVEDEICEFIEVKIETAIERGELRKCDPKITSFLMFKMYVNLVNDWKERHEPLDKDQIAELINTYFIEGIGMKNEDY